MTDTFSLYNLRPVIDKSSISNQLLINSSKYDTKI